MLQIYNKLGGQPWVSSKVYENKEFVGIIPKRINDTYYLFCVKYGGDGGFKGYKIIENNNSFWNSSYLYEELLEFTETSTDFYIYGRMFSTFIKNFKDHISNGDHDHNLIRIQNTNIRLYYPTLEGRTKAAKRGSIYKLVDGKIATMRTSEVFSRDLQTPKHCKLNYCMVTSRF